MMHVLCSLYDRKAQSYSPAVAYPDRATAIRSFVALLATPDCTPAQWPDDFALYLVGFFDCGTGICTSAQPECILTGQSALIMLHELRQRQQAKGGAVGGTAPAVPPEDSGALAERDSSTPSLPGLSDPSSPAQVPQA